MCNQPQKSSKAVFCAFMKRSMLLCLLVITVGSNVGCSKFFHELQPHRLRRWNYNDSSGRGDSLFSIDDPLTPPNRVPFPRNQGQAGVLSND